MGTNLNSVVKKKKGISINRQELLHKSPIPWAVLLGATLIGAALMVWPNISDWTSKQADIKNMVEGKAALEAKNQNLAQEQDDLEKAFNDKTKEFLKLAQQRFPEKIDGTKVAQIIEIYSILMKINYQRTKTLELNSLSVGTTRNVDGTNYAETAVSINLVIDRQTLKDFIQFLRSSRVTDELYNRVVSSGGGDTASIEFLRSNQLPVNRITSLSLNEERDRSDNSSNSVYNSQIQILFYSKPL